VNEQEIRENRSKVTSLQNQKTRLSNNNQRSDELERIPVSHSLSTTIGSEQQAGIRQGLTSESITG